MTTRARVLWAYDVARHRLRVDDYVTAPQLVTLTGVGKDRIVRILEELVANGEAVCLDAGARHPGRGNARRYARAA
jgi:hypothetical protein